MTEKRFRVQEHCLRSSYGIEAENWLVTNDNHGVVLNNKVEADMVANMFNDVIDVLNELNDEKDELKRNYDLCVHRRMNDHNEIHRLEEENKELKDKYNEQSVSYEGLEEQVERLLDFKDKVFNLIDDKIDELEGRYKFGQEVYRGCPMHNIRFGINILKKLKKELTE